MSVYKQHNSDDPSTFKVHVIEKDLQQLQNIIGQYFGEKFSELCYGSITLPDAAGAKYIQPHMLCL